MGRENSWVNKMTNEFNTYQTREEERQDTNVFIEFNEQLTCSGDTEIVKVRITCKGG